MWVGDPSSIPCGPRLGPNWAKLGPGWAPVGPDWGPFGNAARGGEERRLDWAVGGGGVSNGKSAWPLCNTKDNVYCAVQVRTM